VFKNLLVYRMAAGWTMAIDRLDELLAQDAFTECGASQEKSVGWIPPRGKAHGAFVEVVDGQWLLKLMIETKAVPASVIKRKVDEQCAQIEASTGRKPGKKESRDIKDDAKLALLPMAFSKQGTVQVWIDPKASLVMLDAGSSAKADEVLTCLAKAIDGLGLSLVQTTVSAASAMAEWLRSGEPPAGFAIMRECELKAADETQAVVRYARHALDIDEVRQHIAAGKLPTKLALNWDDRVNFILTDAFQIKKISFEDVVFEGTSAKDDDGFDTDAAIATGELRKLIPDLVLGLGGELATGASPG
jgi:recombination associated protein RdgC